jgi:KaiC/GvpD/RAD55 family RecA-like ATPase
MGTREDVREYIERKKWQHKTEQGQYRIKTCPFCLDDGFHFYINQDTGQYQCWKCDEKPGNLYKLKRKLKDSHPISTLTGEEDEEEIKIPKSRYNTWRKRIGGYHKNLKGDEKVQKQLKKKWGFTTDGIEKFKLGVRYGKKDEPSFLVIPAFERKKLVNAKFRTLPPAKKRFHRIRGMKSSLYNVDCLDYELDYIIMLEGETDTITMQMLEFKNVVGVTVGAKGFKSAWYDIVSRFRKVYILYDPDSTGRKGAENLARRVGIDRCWNVLLPPGADVTEFVLAGNGYDEIQSAIDSAIQFDVDGVVSVKGALKTLAETIREHGNLKEFGYKTPWDNVNRLIGDIVPGDLFVLSGKPKVGKSTFALNILLPLVDRKTPALYYCLEMRPERVVPKIISYVRLVSPELVGYDDVVFTEAKFRGRPLYLAHSYSFDEHTIFDTIKESVQRYGIEIIVFDNLHFLVRSSDQTSEVSIAIRNFKLLAEELVVPMIVIAHGRKMSGKSTRMSIEDLRDSSSIGTDADTIIILHREIKRRTRGVNETHYEGDKLETQTEVIVEATRYNPGGYTSLEFAGEWSRFFVDDGEKVKYLTKKKRRTY